MDMKDVIISNLEHMVAMKARSIQWLETALIERDRKLKELEAKVAVLEMQVANYLVPSDS